MNTEPYAGFTAEAEARAGVAQEFREAAADPLPGPLAAAFEGLPEAVAGLRVRKMVHYDFALLRRLNSPLLRQMAGTNGKKGKKGTAFTDEQGYEMVWQFTRPCEEVESALDKLGVSGFRKLTKREIGFGLGPVEVALRVKMVEREVLRSFLTALKYTEKDKGSGETVFTRPPAVPVTGSAGGSITCAG